LTVVDFADGALIGNADAKRTVGRRGEEFIGAVLVPVGGWSPR
jgi:hypothetical protein